MHHRPMILTVVLLLAGTDAVVADVVTFKYDPPPDTAYVERFVSTKERRIGSGAPQVDVATVETRVTIRRADDGWRLTAEPRHVTATRNGERIDNPLVELLASAVITYDIDRAGRVRKVSGYDAFVERLAATLPPAAMQAIDRLVNVDALNAKAIAEWNSRIGDYAGQQMTIGERLRATVPYELPNGTRIEYVTEIVANGIEPCGDSRCVRVHQVYASDASRLAVLSADLVNDTVQALSGDVEMTVTPGGGAISGHAERLIDPDTMRIHAEQAQRSITLSMLPEGGEPEVVTMTETRRYEFEY